MITSRELARLAVQRARMREAMNTARACGDSAWVRDNTMDFEEMNRRFNEAVDAASLDVLEDARMITNTL